MVILASTSGDTERIRGCAQQTTGRRVPAAADLEREATGRAPKASDRSSGVPYEGLVCFGRHLYAALHGARRLTQRVRMALMP